MSMQHSASSDPQTLEMHQGMLSRALRSYWANLRSSIRPRRYLKERGITVESMRRFGLGYADAAPQALRAVFPDYAMPALVESGLVVDAGRGRFDRFRDRIIFPILDDAGRVIAFGGRIINGEGAKYLNSPQTPLFDKGVTLFGMPQARPSIDASGEVLVMEGYLDVVTSAQYGIGNAVATLGTATTSAHIRKLRSTGARRIVFCFDGDKAGRAAAVRALHACIATENATAVELAFMFLPASQDPDDFLRAVGAEVFRTLADQCLSFEEFLVEHLREGKALATCEGRAHMAHDALEILPLIGDAGLYYRVCEMVARDTNLTVAELVAFSETRVARTWQPSARHTDVVAPSALPVAASARMQRAV